MKILSNGRLPPHGDVLKKSTIMGGPMIFEEKVSSFFIEHGHDWVSVTPTHVRAYFPDTDTGTYLHSTENKKAQWAIYTEKEKLHEITQGTDRVKMQSVINELMLQVGIVLDTEKPDIVFLNGFSLFNGLLLQAALDRSIPVVAQHAGIWAIELAIYSDMFSPQGLEVLRAMEVSLGLRASKNIFLTDYSKKVFFEKVTPVDEQKISIIPLPFSHEEHIKSKHEGGTFKIGIVARFDRIKNHKAFLDVAREAKKQGKSWEFYSVTKIPESKINMEFKSEYKESVDVVPPMNSKELDAFYQTMDLMILPSVFDVSPHVVFEALFAGTPTLIADTVGLIDFYTKVGETNYVDDFKDIKKVVEKIEMLKTVPISGKLLPLIKEVCNEEKVLNQYLVLFNEVLLEKANH